MTAPGTTPHWPLPDLRTPEQRARDKAAVQEQVRVLSPTPADAQGAAVNLLAAVGAAAGNIPADIIERIRRRQPGPGDGGTPFVVHEPANGDTPALIVENELVIETDE